MTRLRMLRTRVVLFLVAGVALAAASTSEAKDPELLRLRAIALNTNNQGRMTQIDIVIQRWSTPEEASDLKAVFLEQGPNKLLSRLQKVKPPCGYVRTSTSLGWDIYYARKTDLPEGGQKIVLATDRPVNIWEARNAGRSMDYQFSLAEIHIGKDGKGEGKAIPAAKLSLNKENGTLEIENWAREPVRLNEVTVVEPKK